MAQDHLQQKVKLARLVLLAEQGLPQLVRPAMALGLAMLLVLLGLPQALGFWGRVLFWLAVSGFFLFTLLPLRHLRWPTQAQGLRRLEEDSGLSLRPLAAISDTLAQGEAGLWAAHQARMAEMAKAVRLPRLCVRLAAADPCALRNGLALALIAAFALSGGGSLERLAASLPTSLPTSISVDGWLSPPAYTGQPPIVLAKGRAVGEGSAIAVPSGSSVVMRVAGASGELTLAGKPVPLTGATVTQSGELVLTSGWQELGRWQLSIIPDAPPSVRFTGEAQAKPTGQFSLPYAIADDFGVTSLTLSLSLSDVQEDGEGLAAPGAFLAEPPQVKVPLPGNARQAEAGLNAEFAKHAWAGLMVEARLTARDGAGQIAESAPLRFKLPERNFRNQAARALVEQRKWLLRDANNVPRVVAALDALSIFPDESFAPAGNWLTLRAMTRRLYRAQDAAEVGVVAEDMWNFALALDGGSNLADARDRLEQARKALEQALAENAPQEEIDRLTRELRQAMDDYLKAMAEAARRGELAQNPPQDGKPVRQLSREELSRMLDEMQALSQKGERDKARDMLSALDQILKNLQLGQPQPGEGTSEAMRELRDLLRGQQQLMDRTFRLPKPGELPGPAASGEGAGLERDQAGLAKRLEELLGRLADQGQTVPEALGRAQDNMDEAGEALGDLDRAQALDNQRQALSQLRDGLDRLSEQLMGEGQGAPSEQGKQGQAQGDNDPLGRPQRAEGPQNGSSEDVVPQESRQETTRRILDELRRRSGLPDLSRTEREYYERLLRGLY